MPTSFTRFVPKYYPRSNEHRVGIFIRDCRLDSSNEEVTSGRSSFVDARMSTCEVSTSDSRREEEDSAETESSTSCGWLKDAEGTMFLQVWVER